MAKNNQQFADFLRDEVNLNQSRLDRLETAVGGVNEYLKNNLPGYQKMERQGSYALRTLIKPVDDNDEYDADIQIVMNPNPNWEPRDYVNQVNRTLSGNKTYADKLRLKNRCVTVDYAGDFHLDVVPRVTINGKHYICNRTNNKFEETDGNGYRDWFNDKNRITGGNLKRVVRLLKHLRDDKNSFRAKSANLSGCWRARLNMRVNMSLGSRPTSSANMQNTSRFTKCATSLGPLPWSLSDCASRAKCLAARSVSV